MSSNKSFQVTLLIATLFITCPSITLAQALANNAFGYVITTQGDTIKGTLTVPLFATTKGIILHQTGQSEEKKYTIQDLRAFGLQDGRRFVKRTIPTNRNSESGIVDSSAVFFQHLVAGKANFYRYDFNVARSNPIQQYASPETAQYFIDIANSSPVGVQRRTHQATLAVLFKDCPEVVKLIPRTTFTERGLSNLALRYDTLCQTNTKAYDYRLPEERNTIQLLVSLRAGLQNGQPSYWSSDYFSDADATYSTLPTYALELRLANKNAWSISSGVNYSSMHTRLTKTKPAQLGTANAGQLLALPASVEVNSLQIPILLRYTIGHHTVQPYLAAGPEIGMFANNRTSLSYTTLTYDSGSNSYRNDVITATPLVREKTNPTLSGTVRLGMQIKVSTRVSPLLEIQYTKGRNGDNYPGVQKTITGQLETIGPMKYQAFSAVAGLEF